MTACKISRIVLAIAILSLPACMGMPQLSEADRAYMAKLSAVQTAARQRCEAAGTTQDVAACLAIERVDADRLMSLMAITGDNTRAMRMAELCAPPGTDRMGTVADCFEARTLGQ